MRPLFVDEDQQKCRYTEFGLLQSLWDGDLAFLRLCAKYQDDQGLHPYEAHVMGLEMQSESSHPLRDYALPAYIVRFTFSPDLVRGLLATNTGIEDKLFWLDMQAVRPLNLGLVRASAPAWSEDGQTIVFFGNRQLPGRPGPEWANQPYDLWIMPADCEMHPDGCATSLQVLVNSILNHTEVNWSPDGEWLVFDGDPQNRGRGIWLRRMDSGALIQVLAGAYRVPNWSPDGNRIVVIGPPDDQTTSSTSEDGSALYLLDVSAIVGS